MGHARLTWELWDLATNSEQCYNKCQHVPTFTRSDPLQPKHTLTILRSFKRSNKSVTLVTGFLCTRTRMAKIGISRVCNTSHFSTCGLDSQSVAKCLPLDVGSGYKRWKYLYTASAYCKCTLQAHETRKSNARAWHNLSGWPAHGSLESDCAWHRLGRAFNSAI